jgi:hypothetical protein
VHKRERPVRMLTFRKKNRVVEANIFIARNSLVNVEHLKYAIFGIL